MKPNYLLWGLLVLSVMAHGMILFSVPEIFRFKQENPEEVTVIELLVPEESPLRETPPLISEIKPLRKLETIEKTESRQAPSALVAASEVLHEEQASFPVLSDPVAIPLLLYRPKLDSGEVPPPKFPQVQTEKEAETIETSGTAMDDYLEAVRERIELNKKYPYSARRREVEGQVTVSFLIELDGAINGLLVKRGSGSSVLNKAALKAVEESVPFPQPPADLFRVPVYLEITIVFKMM